MGKDDLSHRLERLLCGRLIQEGITFRLEHHLGGVELKGGFKDQRFFLHGDRTGGTLLLRAVDFEGILNGVLFICPDIDVIGGLGRQLHTLRGRLSALICV